MVAVARITAAAPSGAMSTRFRTPSQERVARVRAEEQLAARVRSFLEMHGMFGAPAFIRDREAAEEANRQPFNAVVNGLSIYPATLDLFWDTDGVLTLALFPKPDYERHPAVVKAIFLLGERFPLVVSPDIPRLYCHFPRAQSAFVRSN